VASTGREARRGPAEAFDIEALITGPSGGAAAVVFSFVRRSEAERRFLAGVLLAKLATWVAHRRDTGGFAELNVNG